MKRKSILSYRKDGKPIRTDLGGIYKHQIAVLCLLMFDNADDYTKVQSSCENVIDDIYDNVSELKSSTYMKKLCNLVESKVSKDLFCQGLLLLQTLIDVQADDKKAKKLMIELEKMCDDLNNTQSSSKLSRNQLTPDMFKNKMYRLNRVMKRNYQVV